MTPGRRMRASSRGGKTSQPKSISTLTPRGFNISVIDRKQKADDATGIAQVARQLLTAGSVGDESLRRSATVLPALPVLAPDGTLHSWFVPITVSDRLAAFFQFLPDGTLMRFSSFQRRPGDFTDCPLAADWLDLTRIKARAEVQRRMDETASEPFLTYDRSPDRLVWAVPLIQAGGEVRHVYVVGETVYVPPPEGTFD
jgi:hypothetical protein